ncbi:penicillin-binding protein 2 [bacterium]|nr:penicillin-binding protein 2 [bacterium]
MDARRGHKTRVYTIAAGILAVYGALFGRLCIIQVSDGEHYRALAKAQHISTVRLSERRGLITDRSGRTLAVSVKVASVFANPRLMRDIPAVARRLALLLGMEQAKVEKRLGRRLERVCLKSGLKPVEIARFEKRPIVADLGNGIAIKDGSVYVYPARVKSTEAVAKKMARLFGTTPADILGKLTGLRPFVFVKRKVTQEERERVLAAKLPGVSVTSEYQRTYPQGVAAALVGFVGIDENGLEGIERAKDDILSGTPGHATFRRDAPGRLISDPSLSRQAAVPGCDIELTLDVIIQRYAEEALEEVTAIWAPRVGATAIVLDPRTGDVLAAASNPSFDANDHGELSTDNLRKRCRARYIADWMEPGSVMKPFVLAGAFTERLVNEESIIFCENGVWILGARRLRDHHAYGNLTAEMVIVKSSNIGAGKLGRMLGPKRLYTYLSGFGFGQATGFPMPGENPGLLRHWSTWRRNYSLPSISMGQEVCTTTLQMALAYATLANDGQRMAPRLVRRVTRPDGTREENAPRALAQVIPASVAKRVRTILFRTVEEGTGTRAKSKLYSIGGKTGTAQKTLKGKQKGFSHRDLICSFVALAPIENPRVVVIVAVDEPSNTAAGRHYGGTVAAPAVGQIIQRTLAYMGVEPDKPQLLARLDGGSTGRRTNR